jgi:uncharacterized protein (DUF433 family)
MNVQQQKMPSGESLFASDPDVMGGRLVFRGTRIPVEVLFENLADGMSLDEILDAYPGLARDSAVAAIELAGATIEQVSAGPSRRPPFRGGPRPALTGASDKEESMGRQAESPSTERIEKREKTFEEQVRDLDAYIKRDGRELTSEEEEQLYHSVRWGS